MAFKAFLIAMIVATVVAPALSMEYMVGDDAGWGLEVNYTEWTQGKEFYVGDQLMFMYNTAFHNVAKVSAMEFQACTSTNTSNQVRTGNDVITLVAPGKKWYICSLYDHCTRGMKLVITVNAAPGPAPTPMPSSANIEFSPLKFSALVLTMVASFKMMIA